MSRTIWKYALSEAAFGGSIPIAMPQSARILHVQSQRGTPCIWAEVDPDAPHEERLFMSGEVCECACHYEDTYDDE